MLVLGEGHVQWAAKCSKYWAESGRIFEQQAAFSRIVSEPGWDGTMKDIPGPG
jgi:hypothetical protein